jgi:16S rRNA (guanine527-N7)-methyltransferase
LEERHIADSLRAVRALGRASRAHDLGSGAGLPGVPLAIALPGTAFTLIEPARKRAAFLELVIDELGLSNARVVVARAEDVGVVADVCVARALAPLERAWSLARPLLEPGGCLVYFAGESFGTVPDLPDAGGLTFERSNPSSVLESVGPLVIITRT